MPTFDTNRSYCKRLAEVTLYQIAQEKAGKRPNHAAADLPLGSCPAPPARSRYVPLDRLLSEFFTPGAKELATCLTSVEALAAALELRPDVQSRLTPLTEYTVSKWLLERELESCCCWTATPDDSGQLPDAYEAAFRRNASGLCLSGGGIRSATFSLGVLQGLSRLGVLSRLDYLSSVSGGGYMHQFLANWIHRTGGTTAVEELLDPIPRNTEAEPRPQTRRASVQPEPLRWLRRYSNYLAPRKGLLTLDTWTIGATWIRNTGLNLLILLSSLFCVLLLPHLGTIPYAHLAGHPILLRLAIVGASLYGVYLLIMLWVCMEGLKRERTSHDKTQRVQSLRVFVLASVSLFVAAILVSPFVYRSAIPGGALDGPDARNVFQPAPQPETVHYTGDFEREGPGHESINITLDTAAARPPSALSAHWNARPTPLWRTLREGHGWPIASYGLYCAVLLLLIIRQCQANSLAFTLLFLAGVVSAYLFLEGVRLLFFVLCFAVPYGLISSLAVTALPPLLFTVPFLLLEQTIGLLGHITNSSQREWLARWRALSLLVGSTWLGLMLCSLFGPWAFHSLAGYAKTSYAVWGAWLATTIAGVLSARNNKTSQPQDSSSSGTTALEVLAAVAPPLFVVGLLVLLSSFVGWSLQVPPNLTYALHQDVHRAVLLFFGSALLAALFGWRVDINDFSMHAFYRDRIARCYAGATNPQRTPNLFTGMARSDRALAVHELLPRGYRPLDPDNKLLATYAGPFPIFCTAINLTTGEDLAYQERKAASFAFTPLFSGYSVGWTAARTATNQLNGFVDTRTYVYQEMNSPPEPTASPHSKAPAELGKAHLSAAVPDSPPDDPVANWDDRDWDDRGNADAGSISVATASAISGAAASPNMGYHSNPAAAFLLTVFNVRLGWWLRNPRRRQIDGRSPYAASRPAPTPSAAKPTAAFWRRLWPFPRPVVLANMPSSPRVGFFSLFKELFGHSDDTTPYIYLTDGGHFDNMGLYELLRRRCRTVIVCDAESDPHLHFEGIGMAIRKARLDFGVEVTLDRIRWTDPAQTSPAAEKDADPPPSQDSAHPSTAAFAERKDDLPYVLSARLSQNEPTTLTGTLSRQIPPPTIEGLSSFAEFPANSIHCVHGTIRYPEDGTDDRFGHILYLKASLTGDEPPDLLNYRMQHPAFPNDTTLNQFFTESQFESYRRLGEHITLEDKVVLNWLTHHLGAVVKS